MTKPTAYFVKVLQFATLALISLHFSGWAAAEEAIEYAQPKKIGKLEKKIRESSGLAVSQIDGKVLWTHNDSGGDARLFAIDMKGDTVGSCQVKGVKNNDWEDMASFKMNGTPYLLIGDFGDNGHVRKEVMLHLVHEPDPSESKVKVTRTIPFTYENGSHDCECVAVDPTDQTILLIIKGWTPMCQLYSFTLPAEDDNSKQIAKYVATIKLAAATGMDISPDGQRAVVVTYGHAYEYHRDEGESWKDAFSREGREIIMPKRKQGEAICYGKDGQTLFVTSEKSPSPLFRIQPRSERDESQHDEPEHDKSDPTDEGTK